MPNKTSLTEIKLLLPSFVQIIESSYKGKRYNADFIDLDYNETFTALVDSVIRLQHGCKQRSNNRRRYVTNTHKKKNRQYRIPLNDVLDRLPKFLSMDISTYSGIRNKATFHDKEYDTHYQTTVANIMRGRGYCSERRKNEFRNKVTIPVETIQKRVKKLYNNEISLVEDSYNNTNGVCSWVNKNGIIFKSSVAFILSGRYGLRRALERWKAEVFVRDKWKCRKCQSEENICGHHIKPFSTYPDDRLNIENGITLCSTCHNDYHSRFKNTESPENFNSWFELI